jgi:hypothetical protein
VHGSHTCRDLDRRGTFPQPLASDQRVLPRGTAVGGPGCTFRMPQKRLQSGTNSTQQSVPPVVVIPGPTQVRA